MPSGNHPECVASAQSNHRQISGLARPNQLHPWLVPHSMQTPHAPARMTLSLPHTEQVIPMKMLPSATMTRSELPLPFPVCPEVAGSLPDLFVITSITSFSPVRAKSVTGRFTAFFSSSTISLRGKDRKSVV